MDITLTCLFEDNISKTLYYRINVYYQPFLSSCRTSLLHLLREITVFLATCTKPLVAHLVLVGLQWAAVQCRKNGAMRVVRVRAVGYIALCRLIITNTNHNID